MIIVLRQYMRGMAVKVILGFMAISMIGVVPFLFRGMGSEAKIAITINKKKIHIGRFNQRVQEEQRWFNNLRKEEREYYKILMESSGQDMNPKRRAANAIIEETILQQASTRLGINPTEEFVLKNIMAKYHHFFQAQDGYAALEAQLKRQGKTMDEFEETVKDEVARDLSIGLIGQATYVPQFQLKQEYIKRNVSKKYSLLTFSYKDYEKKAKKEAVSDDVLKKFFIEKNKEAKKYWVSEKRSGKVWEFDYKTFKMNVTDRELKHYYNLHKTSEFSKSPTQVEIRMILSDNEDKIKKIHTELETDSSKFADIAKKESEDKETSANGGFVGFIKKGELNKMVEKAAFGLKKDGEISGVVRSDKGFVIIKRISRKKAEFTPFEKVKSSIEDKKRKEKFKRSFDIRMGSFSRAYQSDPKLLETVVKKYNGKAKDVKNIEKDGTPLAKNLFKGLKNKLGHFTSASGLEGTLYMVNDIEKSYKPKFEDAKKEVEKDYYENLAHKLLSADLKKAKDAKDSFENRVGSFDAKLEKTDWVDPKDSDQMKKLADKDLPVFVMVELEKVGAIRSFIDDQKSHNGYLIKLNEMKKSDESEVEKNLEELKPSIYRESFTSLGSGFVASLYRNAKIIYNESFLKTKDESSE